MDQTHAVNCDISAKPDWLGLCLPFKLEPEPSLKFKGGKDVFGRGAHAGGGRLRTAVVFNQMAIESCAH